MAKKFRVLNRVLDEDYEIEELEDEDVVAEEEVVNEDACHDAEPLTDDEINALRQLAAVADKLVALINKDDVVADEEEEMVDADPIPENEEEIVDTEVEEPKMHDSFGSIEAPKVKANDSIFTREELVQTNIASSFQDRYNTALNTKRNEK